MTVALVLYCLAASAGVQALPIPSIKQRASLSCDDLHSCRTIPDIIWSCTITIFSCTWVAVHPNIPAPDEKWHTVALRRFQITVMALVAPELVILWAIRQRIMARKLAKEYRKYGWTMAHGFFAEMGGFILFEGDSELRTLEPTELEPYLENGDINITEKEIQDKSRGDILSKGFVILQTGWFVLQCIARQVDRLPITELELVTLAFAALNFVTYGFWWHKPLSVECPYPVLRKKATIMTEVEGEGEGEGRHEGTLWGTLMAMTAVACAVPQIIRQAPGIHKVTNTIMHTVWHVIQNAVGFVGENKIWVIIKQGGNTAYHRFLVPFGAMGWGNYHGLEEYDIKTGAKRVPTFYSGDQKNSEKSGAAYASAAIAMIFGVIHCIAWSFEFSSHTEQLLWRMSSLVITCIPLLIVIISFILVDYSTKATYILGHTVAILVVILYIVCRIMLLVLAFMSLRKLPPAVYQTVRWTTFIPHI